MSKQIAVCLVAIAALAVAVQTTPAARQDTMKPQLVKTIVDKKLGRVLTTAGKRAIYVWNKEPKGKVRCTGACAKAWPPVHREGRRGRADARQGDHGRVRHRPPREWRAPADVQPPRSLHLRAREAGPGAVQQRRQLVRGQGARMRRGGAQRDAGRAARLRPPHLSCGDRSRAVVAALGEARVAGRLWSGPAAPGRAAVRADPVVGLAHLHGRVDDAPVRPEELAATSRRAGGAAGHADVRGVAPSCRARSRSRTSTA